MPDYVTEAEYTECIKRIDANIEHIDESVNTLIAAFAEKTEANGDQNIEITKVVGRIDVLEKEKDAQNKRIAKWVGIIALIIAVVSNLDKIAKAFGG